jgi:hypothetical protein
MSYPVHTVDDAYDACHPEEPLKSGDPRYVDLTVARGNENLAQTVALRISRTKPPRFHQQLVSGHRGCGKSTELRQLQAKLQDRGFFVVYLDAEETLDLGEIKYQDVLVAITKAIEEDLRENGVKITTKLREQLDEWFADRILIQEKKLDLEATLKTEFGIDAKLPLLARVLAAITGQIKSASSRRSEIRRKLEQELSVFIERLNLLIGEARRSVKAKKYNDLVVLIDGLEKMQFREESDGSSNHLRLFVHHAEQLKAPQCHIVYTVPIFLAFNANLSDSFSDQTEILPMVNYLSNEGRERLREVVSKRVDVNDVFDDQSVVDRLIGTSGGSIRDLLRLVRVSCEGGSDKITDADAERAVQNMSREFDRLLLDEDLDLLMRVASEKRISADQTTARLLRLRLVQEYQNGERWADLHPALREVSRVKECVRKKNQELMNEPTAG